MPNPELNQGGEQEEGQEQEPQVVAETRHINVEGGAHAFKVETNDENPMWKLESKSRSIGIETLYLYDPSMPEDERGGQRWAENQAQKVEGILNDPEKQQKIIDLAAEMLKLKQEARDLME